MTAYMFGLLTVPALLATSVAVYLLLAGLARALPIISRTISHETKDWQRNALAATVGASRRSWRISGGQSVLLFLHGIDGKALAEARKVLDEEGPWPTVVKLDDLPFMKPTSTAGGE